MITSIYPKIANGILIINARFDGYSKSYPVSISNLPNTAQSLIASLVAELATAVLKPGETAEQIILDQIKINALVTETSAETVDGVVLEYPTAWRSVIPANITVSSHAGNQPRLVTSEILTAPVRDGLLDLWSTLDALTPEQLEALA